MQLIVVSPKVVNLIDKFSNDRQNSFWYYNREIAIVEYQNVKLSIKSVGDISIQFEKNGDMFTNNRAVAEAMSLHFTDRQIEKYINNFGLQNKNYFIISDINTNEQIDIAQTYDEAIEIAQQLSVEMI
jgi:hypothetical protein